MDNPAYDQMAMENDIPFIFWNPESKTPNRYWMIAKYHDHGLWLFYWNEGDENWVTFQAVDGHFLMGTILDPRATHLVEREVPGMYEAMRKARLETRPSITPVIVTETMS